MATSSLQRDWQQIFRQTLAGDPEAFGALWQDYLYPKLYPYAIKLSDNREEADDLMQSVFVHVFDDARYQTLTRQELDSFTGYIRRMIRNFHTDTLRKAKHTEFLVTPETLTRLQAAGVSATIQAQLASLQHRPPVSQETFLNAVRNVLGAALTDPLQALILQASRVGQRRSHELTPELLAHCADAETTLPELEQTEIVQIFAEEIRQTLTDTEWLVFSRKHWDEKFSYHKLAEQTGIPHSTLYEHYQRARTKILHHPKFQTYWDIVRVTERDVRDLAAAREFRYRLGQPHKAQFVLTLLNNKWPLCWILPSIMPISSLPAPSYRTSARLALFSRSSDLIDADDAGLLCLTRQIYAPAGLFLRERPGLCRCGSCNSTESAQFRTNRGRGGSARVAPGIRGDFITAGAI